MLYRVLWAKWFATGSRRLSKHPACYTGLRCAPSGSWYLCSQWSRVLLEGLCFVLQCSSTQMASNRTQEAIQLSIWDLGWLLLLRVAPGTCWKPSASKNTAEHSTVLQGARRSIGSIDTRSQREHTGAQCSMRDA